MRYRVHRRGGYYHAKAYLDVTQPILIGLHQISPYWDPFRLILSAPIDVYSTWTIRAYRWRIEAGRSTWTHVKAIFEELLSWAVAEDLGYALELLLKSRSIFVNCDWGASSRRPGRKGRYDGREDELEERIKKIAIELENLSKNPGRSFKWGKSGTSLSNSITREWSGS